MTTHPTPRISDGDALDWVGDYLRDHPATPPKIKPKGTT